MRASMFQGDELGSVRITPVVGCHASVVVLDIHGMDNDSVSIYCRDCEQLAELAKFITDWLAKNHVGQIGTVTQDR